MYIPRVIGATYLTSAPHAIMRDLYLPPIRSKLSNLIKIRCPWQIERDLLRDLREGRVQITQRIRLHSRQIKDLRGRVTRASPGRAREHDDLVAHGLEPLRDQLEAVTLKPPYLVGHAVHGGVVLSTFQYRWVLFYGEDAVPAPRQGEGDRVAARAGEGVDEDGGGGRGGCGYVLGNLAMGY